MKTNILSTLLRKWTQSSLVLRILAGLVIGAALGLSVPGWTGIGILGTIFVSALKAIAPVLVAILVMASIAKAHGGLGARFRTVVVLYLVSTLTAALVASVGSTLFPITLRLQDVAQGSAPSQLADVFANLLGNMVTNPLQSITTANYIGILFWAILAGLALKIVASPGTIQVVSDLADVITLLVKWIIQFAPFGILGLVFSAVSESGMEIFTTYGKLVLLLVGCMLFNTTVLNPLWAFVVTGKNPYPLLWICLKESGLNAFFTRSSAANIPINIALCKKLGLDEDFYSVSIPLGATINMNGNAAYYAMAATFIAQMYGMELSLPQYIAIIITSTLGAVGQAGVPGPTLLVVAVLVSAGIPIDALPILFGVDRIFDMLRTAVNITGDAACATIVDRFREASENAISIEHAKEA